MRTDPDAVFAGGLPICKSDSDEQRLGLVESGLLAVSHWVILPGPTFFPRAFIRTSGVAFLPQLGKKGALISARGSLSRELFRALSIRF